MNQPADKPKIYTNLFQTFGKIVSDEGPLALWRGGRASAILREQTGRGDAAAATRIFRDWSRRRRGDDADIPQARVHPHVGAHRADDDAPAAVLREVHGHGRPPRDVVSFRPSPVRAPPVCNESFIMLISDRVGDFPTRWAAAPRRR